MAGTLTETRNLLFNNAIWDSQLHSPTPNSRIQTEISSSELQALWSGSNQKPIKGLSFRKLCSKEFRIDPAPVSVPKESDGPSQLDTSLLKTNLDNASGTILLKVPRLQEHSKFTSSMGEKSGEPLGVQKPERRRSNRRVGASTVSFCQVRDIAGLPPREVDRLLSESDQVGRLLDISLEGMACLTRSVLTVGDEVVFRLTNPKTGSTVDTTARVLRCQDIGRQYHSLHLQLLTPLAAEHIQDLSEPNIPTGNSPDPSSLARVPAIVEEEPLI